MKRRIELFKTVKMENYRFQPYPSSSGMEIWNMPVVNGPPCIPYRSHINEMKEEDFATSGGEIFIFDEVYVNTKEQPPIHDLIYFLYNWIMKHGERKE